MKKIVLVILVFVCCQLNVYAEESINERSVNTTIKIVEKETGEKLKCTGYMSLYDIEGMMTYLYIETKDGYIISSIKTGEPSEYSLNSDFKPYNISNKKNNMYCGPYNYFTFDSYNELQEFTKLVNPEIYEKNRAFLDGSIEDNSQDSIQSLSATWTGVSSSRMQKYSSGLWENNGVNYPSSAGYPALGICGTIATAGLLAYYQDYVNSNYVPSTMRTRYSSNPGTLITTLFTYIDASAPNGTVNYHLQNGGNSFLQDYSVCYQGHRLESGLLTVWNTAVYKINQGYPLVIGLLGAYGSGYGDHWVLAYGYYDDTGSNSDKLRVVDNHGDYDARVNRAWISAYVMVDN